jgi:hypothetical protein
VAYHLSGSGTTASAHKSQRHSRGTSGRATHLTITATQTSAPQVTQMSAGSTGLPTSGLSGCSMRAGERDASGVPDYNAVVEVLPAS